MIILVCTHSDSSGSAKLQFILHLVRKGNIWDRIILLQDQALMVLVQILEILEI